MPGSDYLGFLGPHGDLKFKETYEMGVRCLFGAHGFAVDIDLDALNSAYLKWLELAKEWSFRTRTPDGELRKVPDPACLSRIKHSGIMLHTLNETSVVTGISQTNDAFVKELARLGVQQVPSPNPQMPRYPNEMAALTFVGGVFNRWQASRSGEPLIKDFENPPMSHHYQKNFCVMLRTRTYTPESLYMIFKTMDLYTIIPDVEDNLTILEGGKREL